MAGKIPKETKDAILRAYRQGGKSKAQIAREYEVSVSSVTRIVTEATGTPGEQSRTATRNRQTETGSNAPNRSENQAPAFSENAMGVHTQLERALLDYHEVVGEHSLNSLIGEFVSWISRRDKGEKELISLEMAIESLKLERSSIENEISRLGSKAGSLEILIGKMRKLAEDSQMDLSLVEERLANIEEKLSIDHDILLIGSAMRMILKGENLDEELVSMIADISNLRSNDRQEIRNTVRRALNEYSDFFRKRISNK